MLARFAKHLFRNKCTLSLIRPKLMVSNVRLYHSQTHNQTESIEQDTIRSPLYQKYLAQFHQQSSINNILDNSNTEIELCHYETAKLCMQLNEWMEIQTNDLPLHPLCNAFDDKKWGKQVLNNGDCVVLRPNVVKDTLYIIFKGTTTPSDVVSDLCSKAKSKKTKYGDDSNQTNTYFTFVHNGLYGDMSADYDHIEFENNYVDKIHEYFKDNNFKTIIVTGHSRGGGMATLFAYKLLRYEQLPKDVNISVITFGSPMIFAKKSDNNHLLNVLSKNCHHFVNRLDPIPRLPTSNSWLTDTTKKIMQSLAHDTVHNKTNQFISRLVSPNINRYTDELIDKLQTIDNLEQYDEYFPCGIYYSFCGRPDYENNNGEILQITDDGSELHFNPFDGGNIDDINLDSAHFNYSDQQLVNEMFEIVLSNHFMTSYAKRFRRINKEHVNKWKSIIKDIQHNKALKESPQGPEIMKLRDVLKSFKDEWKMSDKKVTEFIADKLDSLLETNQNKINDVTSVVEKIDDLSTKTETILRNTENKPIKNSFKYLCILFVGIIIGHYGDNTAILNSLLIEL